MREWRFMPCKIDLFFIYSAQLLSLGFSSAVSSILIDRVRKVLWMCETESTISGKWDGIGV
jgi:hypothetical protein